MSVAFNGAKRTVSISGSPAAYPYSVAFWINFDYVNNWNGLLYLWDSSASRIFEGFFDPGSPGQFVFYSDTHGYVNGSSGITAGAWNHFAWTHDGTTGRGYTNGVQVVSATYSGSGTLSSIDVGTSDGNGADCTAQDVCVWSAALSADEINQAYRSRMPPQPGALVAWWPLNGGGGYATDHSGRGRALGGGTGTPTNGTSNPPASWSTRSVGRPLRVATSGSGVSLSGGDTVASTLSASLIQSNALAGSATSASTLSATLSVTAPGQPTRFTGSSSYTRSVSISGSQVHTLCCWARSEILTTDCTVMHLDNGTDTDSSRIGFVDSGSGSMWGVFVQHRTGAGSTAYLPVVSTATWHHVALVIDGTNQVSFIDGVQVDSRAFNASLRTTGFTTLKIGDQFSASSQDETLYDAQLYTSALSAADIYTVMRGSIPGGATLYGRWMLDRSGPTTDSSGNARTLTVNGTPGNATKNVLYGPGTQVASTLDGSLTTTKPITGSTTSASTLAAAITALLTATTSSASTLAATLAVAKPLAGATTVASTLAGALTAQIAGSSSVASTLSATLGTGTPVAGSSTVSSTLAGALAQAQPLAGTDGVASTLAGSLTVTVSLVGASAAASTLAAGLIQAQPLAGTMGSASTLTASIGTGTQIGGTSSVASTLTAALTQLNALAGAQTVASTLTATLAQAVGLAGADGVASTLAGSLTQVQALAGAASSASTLSATLGVGQQVAGTLAVSSTLAGALVQAQALAGSTSSASSLAASLGTTKPLTGGTTVASTLSASLGVVGVFQGASTVASTLAGSLTTTKPVSGTVSDASTLAAALSVAKPLAGSHAVASTLAGQLGLALPLAGSGSVASTLSATLQQGRALAGATSIASTLTGQLLQVQALVGSAAVSSTLTATLTGGSVPILPTFSGWSDGGDTPDVVSQGVWTAWSEEVSAMPHGRWSEDPVSGGVELHPELVVPFDGVLRSSSRLVGAISEGGVQPALAGTIGGAGSFWLQKNWNFGTGGNVGTFAQLNAEFTYHDPFNTITNGTNYGAMIVRAPGAPTFGVYNYADIGLANDQQPVDPGTRYRSFTSNSMLANVMPLNTGSVVVGPASTHNAGCGSIVSQLTLPAAGARLGADIVWETRVRMVTAPNGYWFALWLVGPQWDGGPEVDLIEAFSSTSPNVNGDLWNNGAPGASSVLHSYSGSWDATISTLGIPGYALPGGSQSLLNWHTFTLYYSKTNAFSLYMDSTLINSGVLDWKVPTGSTVPPLSFLFDFGFGHTAISPINAAVISDITATPLQYEINYSRIWLR